MVGARDKSNPGVDGDSAAGNNPSVSSMVAMAAQRTPRLGSTRLILVDGPAGSGKTTLGNRLGERLNCQVLHTDDMYEGWGGLSTLNGTLEDQILTPLAAGESGGFARWDWEASARAERIDVPAAGWLVIEGVGCANAAAREFASAVVWVEAPWEERLRRGLERDGEHMRAHWERWQTEEQRHFAENQTRANADFLIDGTRPVPQ